MESNLRNMLEIATAIVALVIALTALLKSSLDRKKIEVDIAAQYAKMLGNALEREQLLKADIARLEEHVNKQDELIESLRRENANKDKKIKELQRAIATLKLRRS